MNEMIPRVNNVPAAEKAPEPAPETVLNQNEFTPIVELAPSIISLEEIGTTINAEIDAAIDYPAVMDILEVAISNYGHQTIETIMLSRFNNQSTEANKVLLDLIKGISETQTVTAVESLADPDFEGVSTLLEMVSKYTEEEIHLVTNITEPSEAIASPERKLMKNDLAPIYKLACKLRWESKAALDTDRTLYPEFWQIFDKFEAIHQAIGIINTIQNTVRHNLTVKL
jgi:hypothetical protein